MRASRPPDLPDERSIAATIVALVHAIDVLDWPAVRHAFAAEVDVDYTSLAGGEPARLPADQLVASWQRLLPGFDATQHLLGPIVARANGDEAEAGSHVRGYHVLRRAVGGDVWLVAGHYTFRLQRRASSSWQIAAMKLTVFYQEGNLQLPAQARERAQSGRIRGA